MKLAIMQPYFFPYIGYFQLIAGVDKFVFYDDVNFIKNGWINRNRLYLSGDVRYITVPLSGASPHQKINQVQIQMNDNWRKKMLESIRHAYSKAPYFTDVFALLTHVLSARDECIATLAKKSVVAVSNYLGIKVQFVDSSDIYQNADLNGAQRVIDICLNESASHYYNLPGGKALYNSDEFTSKGVALGFINAKLKPYPQLSKEFAPGLSIVDVLMFNDVSSIREMLNVEVAA